jgi:hypothetical protein
LSKKETTHCGRPTRNLSSCAHSGFRGSVSEFRDKRARRRLTSNFSACTRKVAHVGENGLSATLLFSRCPRPQSTSGSPCSPLPRARMHARRSHREPAALDLVDAVAGALQERVGAAPKGTHDEEAQRLLHCQHLHTTRQPARLPSAGASRACSCSH